MTTHYVVIVGSGASGAKAGTYSQQGVAIRVARRVFPGNAWAQVWRCVNRVPSECVFSLGDGGDGQCEY
jgi:hypothetical protein